MTSKIYLHLGSNMGNRLAYLQQACDLITLNIGKIIACSKVYETAAWGKTNQADFLNIALVLDTELTALNLLKSTQAIEQQLGRIKKEHWGTRVIDIDILFYNQAIIATPTLTIPHPYLHKRRFVLVPLLDIALYFIHPVLNKTIEALNVVVEDDLEVKECDVGIVVK